MESRDSFLIYFYVAMVESGGFFICGFFEGLCFAYVLTRVTMCSRFFVTGYASVDMSVLIVVGSRVVNAMCSRFAFVTRLSRFLVVFRCKVFTIGLVFNVSLDMIQICRGPKIDYKRAYMDAIIPLRENSYVIASLVASYYRRILFNRLALFNWFIRDVSAFGITRIIGDIGQTIYRARFLALVCVEYALRRVSAYYGRFYESFSMFIAIVTRAKGTS